MTKLMKAIQLSRQGMFVPVELTTEMVDKIGMAKDANILVMFSYEMLPVLSDMGYSNVTVTTDDPSPAISNLASKYGYSAKKLEEVEGMKFDVVIGNPPYQDSSNNAKNIKLWYKFTKMSLDYTDDVVAFVTPESIFRDVDSNGVRIREQLKTKGFGLVDFVRHHNTYFKDVGVATAHWIVSKKHKDTNIDSGVFSTLSPIVTSIVNKVTSYSKKLPLVLSNSNVSRSDLCESGNEIYFSGDKISYTKNDLEYNDSLKLVLPFSSSYKKAFITNKPTGMLNMMMPLRNNEEGQYILNYVLSPLFVFVATHYRKTSGFTPFVKNIMIPDLRNESVSDLYEVFGLTQEEIEYIENEV